MFRGRHSLARSPGRDSATESHGAVNRLFDTSAQTYPAKTAFVQPDGSRQTYAEAAQQTQKIASALHASALPETAKVAIYSPNDARAFSAASRSLNSRTASMLRKAPRRRSRNISREKVTGARPDRRELNRMLRRLTLDGVTARISRSP